MTLKRTFQGFIALLAGTSLLLVTMIMPAPSVRAAGSLALSRYTAGPGDSVAAVGAGFTSGDPAAVTAYLRVNGSAHQVQTAVPVNASGGFRAVFTLPGGTDPGTYAVQARDAHGNTATRYLRVLRLVYVQVGGKAPTAVVLAGHYFYVSGAGFGGNEAVRVAVDAPLYNGNTSTIATTAHTNGAGHFYEALLQLPGSAAAGSAPLTATGQHSGRHANATIRVTYQPSIFASPGSVNPGGTVNISGTGFVPNTRVNVSISFPRTDASTISVSKSPVADGSGNIHTSLALPRDVSPGTHPVTAVDTQGGFRASTSVKVVAAPVPTATSAPTATPTPLPTPPRPKKGLGFRYVSLWYHTVRQGTWDHLTVQAQPAKRLGVWVQVIFPNGVHYYYYDESDTHGLWQRQFNIPRHAITSHSNQAVITVQLWSGKKTARYFMTFTLV